TANLLVDRALANGEMGDYQSALDDITKVQFLVQENADLYVLKASAYRALGKYPEAMFELEKASRIEPQNREAYLERGNLFREMGDKNGARENWIAYLREYPDGPAADLVRRNLENMDVRIEK
ncbi:MAG: tetratricopeptide repeat protein, partial [Sphingomonadales bacterium]